MSGRLVGEVLDAIESGAIELASPNERLALIAIAEKCIVATRQGSVRFGRIQSAIGKSPSTSRRTLRTLVSAGHVRVVKRGYKVHGVAKATIYELAELVSLLDDTSQTAELVSNRNELVSNRAELVSPMDDQLDGSLDGSLDGDKPPRYCPTHMPNGTPQKCRACGTAREAHAAWEQAREGEARQARRKAIDNCSRCDENGMRATVGGLVRCGCNRSFERKDRVA